MIDLIIPVYNEEKRISKAIPILIDFSRRAGIVSSIIFVDDYSTDHTLQIAFDYSRKNPLIRVCRNAYGKGKGGAVKTGMLLSASEFSLFSDVDLSVPIEKAINFLKILQSEEGDIVIASRYAAGGQIAKRPLLRSLISWAGNLMRRFLMTKDIKDSQCGFKMFNARSRKTLFALQKTAGWGFDVELLALAKIYGFRVKEVGVPWSHEEQSRIRPFLDSFRVLRELLKIKWNLVFGKYALYTPPLRQEQAPLLSSPSKQSTESQIPIQS